MLSVALEQGFTDVAKALIAEGCDTNGVGYSGDAALVIAINSPFLGIAKLMIEINRTNLNSLSSEGITALAVAVGFGIDAKIVDLINFAIWTALI